MKFGSTLSISHPNYQDSLTLGDDSFAVEFGNQNVTGKVTVEISDDGGLTWVFVGVYDQQKNGTLSTIYPMIDGSPSTNTRLRLTSVDNPQIQGVTDFFNAHP